MKIKQSLFIVLMVLISLCVISAASAADNTTDVVEITEDVNEVQSIDNVDGEIAVENDAVLEETVDSIDESTLAVDNSGADSKLGDSKFTFGGNGTKFDFSNITFNFGNGTTIDLGSLLNGDRKSTRLNSSHSAKSRMPSSA